MFLEKIADLSLLKHNPESNILGLFPLQVKKTLIQEITTVLSPNTPYKLDPTRLLTSAAHVIWAMEVIGQGFALPIEDVGIIQGSVTVYSTWLLEPNMRPIAIKELKGTDTEQVFLQTIFKHLSLLFLPRKAPDDDSLKDSISIHVELCKAVLKVFLLTSRNIGDSFTNDTWTVLLKVFLGISECILSEPTAKTLPSVKKDAAVATAITTANGASVNSVGVQIADQIGEDLITVFLEIWLRSTTTDVKMWNYLRTLFQNWTHRHEVFIPWDTIVVGITYRIIRLLYDAPEGTTSVDLELDIYDVSLDLPDDYVFYAWHQILCKNLIQNPISLNHENFLAAILTISKVVDAFHTVGQATSDEQGIGQTKLTSTPPDGNTLLHMFGDWLFDAVSKKDPGYELGQAEAFGVLCRIFCSPQRRAKFEQIYLQRFYLAVAEGLRGDSYSVTTIIMNCGALFQSDLEGVRALLPDFLFIGLKRVLPNIQPGFQLFPSVAVDDLRKSAYKILGQVISIPNRFPNVMSRFVGSGILGEHLNTDSALGEHSLLPKLIQAIYVEHYIEDATLTEIKCIKLKIHIFDLLLTSLVVETSPNNTTLCLHLLLCFALEDAELCRGLPALIVKTIVEKILSNGHGQWSTPLVLAGIESLNQFIHLADYIKKHNKNCPREVVFTLCKLLETWFLEDHLVTSSNMIIKAYDCMIKWSLIGEWIASDKDCQNAVISILCRGITVLNKDDEFSSISVLHQGDNSMSGVLLQSSSASHSSGLMHHATSNSTTSTGAFDRERSASPGPHGEAKQQAKRGGRTPTAASKLFEKMHTSKSGMVGIPAASQQSTSSVLPHSSNQSTHTPKDASGAAGSVAKNSSFGIPTFAITLAKANVQTAAEIAMAHLSNHLGNFPPLGEKTGVSSVSSMWCDDVAILEIIKNKEEEFNGAPLDSSNSSNNNNNLLAVSGLVESPVGISQSDLSSHQNLSILGAKTVEEYKKYVKYFAFDKRVIIGLADLPDSSEAARSIKLGENETHSGRQRNLIIILRDATGKYTWRTSLKYSEEKQGEPTILHTIKEQSQATGLLLSEPEKNGSGSNSLENSLNSTELKNQLSIETNRPSNALPNSLSSSGVVRREAIDEQAVLPSVSKLLDLNVESLESFIKVKSLFENSVPSKYDRMSKGKDENLSKKSLIVSPPSEVDCDNNEDASAKIFRLFLSHYGFLSLSNRHNLQPLSITENLLKDLSKFDKLPERECFGISVYYCKSGLDTINELLLPKSIPADFPRFLHTLAWPVDIESHVGYRGGLSVEGCDTAAYYADSHIEIILHCPYLLKVDYVEKSLVVAELRPVSTLPPQIDMIPPLSPSMEDSTMLMTTPHDFGGLSEPNSLKKEGGILLSGRSSSVDTEKKPVQAQDVNDTSGTSNTTANKSHHSNSATHTHKSFANTVSEDLVHVIWIENLDQIHVLAKKILAFFHPKSHHYNQPAPQQQQPQPLRPTSPPAVSNSSGPYVFIFVHPLPHTPSLYLIRLLMIGGEHQAHDMLPFGPLSDGVIISRHSLVLIKNTAVAALYYLKGLRSSNKKPYEKRMHHLEEICNRHKQKNLSLAGFYSLLFAK